MPSPIVQIAVAIAGASGFRSLIDAKPQSRLPTGLGNHLERNIASDSLVDWSLQAARSLRAGSTMHDVISRSFPLHLRGSGTLGDRLRRALTSDISSDERLLLWVSYSIHVFGIPGGIALERTADRLKLREQLRQERSLHSAPARLSARALTALPLATLFLLAVTSSAVRDYIQTMFGITTVLVGLSLNELGRRALRSIIEPSSTKRQREHNAERTDSLEAIALIAMSGVPLRTAFIHAAQLSSPSVRPQFERLAWNLQAGALLADALDEFSQWVSGAEQDLINVIITGQRDGSPMAELLQTFVSNIDVARARSEEHYIRTLPVRLAGPLVGCSLPAFVCLAIVPPLASSLAGLSTSPISSI